MKPWLRFFLGSALAVFAAAFAHAQTLSPTGVSVSPSSALPGDSITITVAVRNSDTTTNFLGTASFSVVFTNLVTGSTITRATAGQISPVGGLVSKGVADPATGQITPGTGSFTFATTVPTQTSESGGYAATATMAAITGGAGAPSSFSVSTAALTVTGKPDLQITALSYAAGTSYVGGNVIPNMSLSYTNNPSTNGTANVPYTPGINGHASFVRIQVVLSSNPTFGDADDFQLTINDISAGVFGSNQTTDNRGNPAVSSGSVTGNSAVLADGSLHTFTWNQVLPGNFSGSYYVLAKIDTLNVLTQNDPPALNVNGNNVWGGNTLNPSGTLINLLPSNFPTSYLASHGTGVATAASGYSDNPSMTADGRYVAFASDAANLASATDNGGTDTNGVRDIFFFDSQTSLVHRLSLSQQGAQANAASNNPSISSANGRYVAFESIASNLVVGDTNGFSDIFVVDTITHLISRVSGANATGGGQANNPSFKPAISQTGRYIVFQSTATNLTATPTTVGRSHIYLYNRDVSGSGTFDTPGNTSTTMIDVTSTGAENNGNAIQAAISADGSRVAFASATPIGTTNLVATVTTAGRQHVYVRSTGLPILPNLAATVTLGATVLVSVQTTTTIEGNGNSQTPSLSAIGNYVAFASLADDLLGVGNDKNGVSDIFVYDNTGSGTNGKVTRMSVSTGGVEGYDPSQYTVGGIDFRLGSINPTISSDGRYVAFASLDANLTTGDTNGQYQGNGATGTPTVAGGAITSIAVGAGGTQYSQASPPRVVITDPSGSGAVYSATVSAAGVVTSINVVAGQTGAGYSATPKVVIASDSNNALDIFVHDRDANNASPTGAGVPANYDTVATTTQMISVNPFGYQTNGPSLLGVPSTAASNIYPVISANGRFVAFPTDAENNAGLAFGATNLLPLDSNGLRDVFLFDRRTTSTITPPTPPTVTITSPGAAPVLVNTAVPLTASATTTIGVVSSVQFFVNGTRLGTSSVFPYTQTWTPNAVGTFTLSALVTDSFGNIGVSANVTVTVNAAPSVGITDVRPTGSLVLAPAVVNIPQTITATAGASNPGATIASVQFFVNGVALPAGVLAAGVWTTSWTPLAAGTFTLTARATDTPPGTQTTSAAVNVTVVTAGGGGGGGSSTPPTVSLNPLPPATGSVNSRITLTATAAAVGVGGSIANVQFFANGILLGTVTTAPYTFVWVPLALGNYSITAVATDNVGASTTSAAATVNINGVLLISINTPVTGSSVPVNTPQTVTATASVTNGTVVSVQFLANGTSIGSASAFPYRIEWTPATPGTYALTAVAIDNTGAQAFSSASTVTVSTGTAPSVTIASPTASASVTTGSIQTIVANATAGAGTGTIVSVQFFANGLSLGTDTVFPYNQTWTPTGTGAVALTAVATDSLGNRTTSTAVNVTVAGFSPGAPTVSLTAPLAGASLPVGVATIVAASATDADGTIASVQFFANGVSIGVKSAFPYNIAFTPNSPGIYVLAAQATDNAGNLTTSSSISVTVSGGTAPTVSVTAPAALTTLGVNTPQTITASASSSGGTITSVQFFVNGVPLSTDAAFPYAAAWTPLALGTYSLTARATDSVGNITDSAPIVVTAGSSAAPTVAVTNPANGSAYTVGTSLNLAADAADSDGTVASVQFFVNGLLQGAADLISPYSAQWTAGSTGVYTITAQATDNTGNVTTSAPITVTIGANAAPTVALTSPATGLSYGLGNSVLIAATAADADGTVVSVQFFANGQNVGTASAAPYNFSWRPTAAGAYRITAVATDNVGNTTTSALVSVTITAAAAPVASVTNPVAGATYIAGNSIPFNATASGGNGPISQVQFFVNGASLSVDNSQPYSATWTPLAPGTYSLLAVATDSAGISSNSPALNVVIGGNAPPTVSITSPPSGTTVIGGTIVNLVAAAADADGTVTTVRFLANGNTVGTASAAPFVASWIPTAAGTYSVTAQASDNSGSVTNSTSIAVTVTANLSPVVALTSPANGTALRAGATTTVTAAATDADGTIASVQFFANGAPIGGAVTALPYRVQWTPAAEGIYRLTAIALDNAGAGTVSVALTVLAVSATSGGSDTVFTGPIIGAGENGRFAVISVRGKTAAFIGYSTANGGKTYFLPSLAVDAAGGFNAVDATGRSTLSGSTNDTGVIASLDAGRITLIGVNSGLFPVSTAIGTGYYTGNLSGKPASSLAAIVGADASVMLYVVNGAFSDAGSGSVDSLGSFSITTLSGNRFTGKADPATGFLSGTLTGVNGGAFMAATGSGISFSDGFLRNLSTRGQVGTGDNVLIAGFVVGGTTAKQILIRAIGPSLTQFGITSALANPQLQVFSGSALITSNDNWGGDAGISGASGSVGAFPLITTSLDSVVLISLQPGAYTAKVNGAAGGTGVALVELYDVDNPAAFSAQKVINVSTRGLAGTGQAQLIAGFVINGNTSKKVLVRGIGPALTQFGVLGVLADPVLRIVRNSDNLVIRENDNWEIGNDVALILDAAAKTGAFALPAGSKDSVILINLPPGSYSAQVSGTGTTTGVASVEVYEVP